MLAPSQQWSIFSIARVVVVVVLLLHPLIPPLAQVPPYLKFENLFSKIPPNPTENPNHNHDDQYRTEKMHPAQQILQRRLHRVAARPPTAFRRRHISQQLELERIRNQQGWWIGRHSSIVQQREGHNLPPFQGPMLSRPGSEDFALVVDGLGQERLGAVEKLDCADVAAEVLKRVVSVVAVRHREEQHRCQIPSVRVVHRQWFDYADKIRTAVCVWSGDVVLEGRGPRDGARGVVRETRPAQLAVFGKEAVVIEQYDRVSRVFRIRGQGKVEDLVFPISS